MSGSVAIWSHPNSPIDCLFIRYLVSKYINQREILANADLNPMTPVYSRRFVFLFMSDFEEVYFKSVRSSFILSRSASDRLRAAVARCCKAREVILDFDPIQLLFDKDMSRRHDVAWVF